MSDMFREVDEALRQEKLNQMWEKHSSLIIGTIIGLIAGVALYTAYFGWLESRNQDRTAILYQAAEGEETDPSMLEGDSLALYHLIKARQALDAEDLATAQTHYEAARDSGASDELTGLAALNLSMMALDDPAANRAPDAPDLLPAPWTSHGLLATALHQADQNQYLDAVATLDELIAQNNPAPPPSLVATAQALRHVFVADAETTEPSVAATTEEVEAEDSAAPETSPSQEEAQ